LRLIVYRNRYLICMMPCHKPEPTPSSECPASCRPR
jgi:hypothetical protein